MFMLLDYDTQVLAVINIAQMVAIIFLIFPIIDTATQSRGVRQIKNEMLKNPAILFLGLVYLSVVFGSGILRPKKILSDLKIPKHDETPQEKLLRIIKITNACRNNLLAGFSLFFLLISIRLLDFVIFSAKLEEFSTLMSIYDIVDITTVNESDDISYRKRITSIDYEIEEEEEEELVANAVDIEEKNHWPSIANFNKQELRKLKEFLNSLDIENNTESASKETQTSENKREKKKRRSKDTHSFYESPANNKIDKIFEDRVVEKAHSSKITEHGLELTRNREEDSTTKFKSELETVKEEEHLEVNNIAEKKVQSGSSTSKNKTENNKNQENKGNADIKQENKGIKVPTPKNTDQAETSLIEKEEKDGPHSESPEIKNTNDSQIDGKSTSTSTKNLSSKGNIETTINTDKSKSKKVEKTKKHKKSLKIRDD